MAVCKGGLQSLITVDPLNQPVSKTSKFNYLLYINMYNYYSKY